MKFGKSLKIFCNFGARKILALIFNILFTHFIMKKSFLLFFAVLFLGLAGCSSEDPKPQTKCLVLKQINANGNYVEYTYNGDLLVKQEAKSASGKVFYTIAYEYSGTKQTKYSQFDNQTGTNILVYQRIYDYNGNNLVKTQVLNYDRTGKLTNQFIITSEFDNNGNKIKDVTTVQSTNSSGSILRQENMITYEYQGKFLIKMTRFFKNLTTNQYLTSGYTSYENDANGNVLQEKSYNNSGQFSSSRTNTYNNANKLVKVVREQNGKNYIATLIEYDAAGNQTLLAYFNEDGKKSYEYKTLREYDAKGNIIKETEIRNDYYDPNTTDFLSTPFTSTTSVYTYEYQCPK